MPPLQKLFMSLGLPVSFNHFSASVPKKVSMPNNIDYIEIRISNPTRVFLWQDKIFQLYISSQENNIRTSRTIYVNTIDQLHDEIQKVITFIEDEEVK